MPVLRCERERVGGWREVGNTGLGERESDCARERLRRDIGEASAREGESERKKAAAGGMITLHKKVCDEGSVTRLHYRNLNRAICSGDV